MEQSKTKGSQLLWNSYLMSKGLLKKKNKEVVYIVNTFDLHIRNMTTNLVSQI